MRFAAVLVGIGLVAALGGGAAARAGSPLFMRVDPGGCRPVCLGDRDARWSPDGLHIASWRLVPRADRPATATVFVLSSRGGHERRVYESPTFSPHLDGLAWSPDGTRLAFLDNLGVVVVRADRLAVPLAITPQLTAASAPRWSPDGRELAFQVGSGPFAGPGAAPEVWVAAADGSSLRRVAGDPGESATSPVWAPNGQSPTSRAGTAPTRSSATTVTIGSSAATGTTGL